MNVDLDVRICMCLKSCFYRESILCMENNKKVEMISEEGSDGEKFVQESKLSI